MSGVAIHLAVSGHNLTLVLPLHCDDRFAPEQQHRNFTFTVQSHRCQIHGKIS
jgi:hypothetical protein